MYAGKGKGGNQAGQIGSVFPIGDAQNGCHKNEGQHQLHNQPGGNISLQSAEPVGPVDSRTVGQISHFENQGKDSRTGQGSQILGKDVGKEVLITHFSQNQHGKGQGRIDVAARNISDGIGHSQQTQAESKGSEQITCAGTAHRHGGSATDHNQNTGSDEFRSRSSECIHGFILLPSAF